MEGTRNAIIQAFRQQLEEKPVSKITVKDIVGCCNINRNTFYYHFQDIPSLIEEMMMEEAEQLIRNHFTPGNPIECLLPLVQYGLRHKNAVLHVYRYVSKDVFLQYVNRIVFHAVQDYFSNIATSMRDVSDKVLADLTEFYKCALVGLLLDWLDGGMKEDMLALTQRLCALLHGSGRTALTRG